MLYNPVQLHLMPKGTLWLWMRCGRSLTNWARECASLRGIETRHQGKRWFHTVSLVWCALPSCPERSFLVVRLKINFATCRSSFSYILWLRRCTQLLCYSPKHFLKDLMRLCESGNSRTQCHSMSFEYFKLLISNFSHLKERRGSDHANVLLWSNAYCGCHASISQLAQNLFCWRYMKWNTC